MLLAALLACSTADHDSVLPLARSAGDKPAVRLLSPGEGDEVENPVMFTIAAQGVHRVYLDADGWPIGDPWDPSVRSTHTYSFTGTGTPRQVNLRGLDAEGRELASHSVRITPWPEGRDPGDSQYLDLPFFDQYANSYQPESSCGVSSAAMLLGFLGSDRSPDDLYERYGKSQAQSPEGLAALYAAEGYTARHERAGTRQELKALLDSGKPVVVHGFWTSAGHIVVLRGYDQEAWIVNDPAGDWYRGYGMGGGEAVRYPYGSDWDDKMSHDGDIWWSTAW